MGKYRVTCPECGHKADVSHGTVEFWINNQLVFPDTEQTDSKNAALVLIPSKKMVYGIMDLETGDMFGPYTAEVLVWQ